MSAFIVLARGLHKQVHGRISQYLKSPLRIAVAGPSANMLRKLPNMIRPALVRKFLPVDICRQAKLQRPREMFVRLLALSRKAERVADAGSSVMELLQAPLRGGYNAYVSLGKLEDN